MPGPSQDSVLRAAGEVYLPRIADGELDLLLSSSGAVVIEGPRACGKTATARRRAGSEVLLDVDDDARQAVALDPGIVLDGEPPRLLDEWQVAPRLWNHVRRRVDDAGRPGMFILTGSATPLDDAVRHTGAGRFTRLRMRTMSLAESGHSTAAMSLNTLLAGDSQRSADTRHRVVDLAELATLGGWPGLRGQTYAQAGPVLSAYVDQVAQLDVPGVGGRRDPIRVARVLRSLARNVSTYATASTIARDSPDGAPVSAETVAGYLDALERSMIVEDVPAWAPTLRSRSRLRSAPKRALADPSLVGAALGVSAPALLRDIRLFGFVFESLVIRDLRVYAQPIGGTVLQYRDNTGLEVDAIVELRDGTWGAFEVKLSTDAIDEAAQGLLRFSERVDTEVIGAPAALGVITSVGYGYRRPDGVHVIPIGALGP